MQNLLNYALVKRVTNLWVEVINQQDDDILKSK